jgi:aspartokinase-like uncharacterized kinase
VAAANWAATARVVALSHPDALLIDIGTTTADIIPIVGGTVAAIGSTDPDRLASGELVYTGALRTSVEAIASHVPFGNGMAGVSAESFALAGDVHVWRGDLAPADYTVTAPDRRPPTREFAGERLARAICADREMLDDAAVTRIADALAASQDALVAGAIRRVRARHPGLHTAVVTGLGAFIAARAARAAGLDVVELSYDLGDAAARCAPAASVALLLDAELTRGSASPRARVHVQQPPSRTSRVDLVVKVGGGLLAGRNHLAAVLAAVADAAARARVLVVPGGGPFADTVRQVDRSLGLSDAAAHWMAILAMDQYAHLLADRLPDNRIVTNAGEVVDALAGNHIPILSPTHWLRAADPLPHSWDVTSDSIAAWVSEQLAAARLVLVKPPAAEGGRILDEYFMRARPNNLEVIAVPGDQIDRLRLALSGAMPGRKTGHYD